eukprot:TRINITY_DN67200_c6_g6_i1.p1 TRINITY_DN67200_c6_g6~~TRINITY_DN67200_c6_g6_i1.p1  ORF type:complete len:134 (-),score=11.35 TRINITY_DN67200_c6_g6_i1:198-599(-)
MQQQRNQSLPKATALAKHADGVRNELVSKKVQEILLGVASAVQKRSAAGFKDCSYVCHWWNDKTAPPFANTSDFRNMVRDQVQKSLQEAGYRVDVSVSSRKFKQAQIGLWGMPSNPFLTCPRSNLSIDLSISW